MIGRFRDRGITSQAAMTLVAGLLIGACWALRFWYPQPAAETALALVATALCGGRILYGAAKGLLSRRLNVDELVGLAIVAALIVGEYLTAATVGFIMVLGSLLESFTSSRSRRAIESLVALAPDTARVVEGSDERIVSAGEVRVGQYVLVKPGEKIAIDGTVVEGNASVDQAAVTGEPMPIEAVPGTAVFAGGLVDRGALTIKATRVGADSSIGKIVALIREAESHQAPIIRSAEAFARWFTPAILLLAAIVWVWSGDFVRCVSVLVVGCPCALILATPTAVVAAMGAAARRGLMIKGGRFLEAIGEVDAVVFDKTGTLTLGRPSVRSIVGLNGAADHQVLSWAASVEQKSAHPLAEAVVREANRQGVVIRPVDRFQSTTGLGVVGEVDGRRIGVGRWEFVGAPSMELTDIEGASVLWVARDEEPIGAIILDDPPRDSAAAAVAELKHLVHDICLLSGDHPNAVARLARLAGIDSWRAELLPHEKVEHLDRLRAAGRKVMYVGDGINDGPALAGSYVGAAFGACASPLALETAPVGILNADLGQVPALIRLGRLAKRRIRENLLVFAVIYNGIAILLASAGWLSPIMGAIVHNVGSVAVVLNSARLLHSGGVGTVRTAIGPELS